MATPPPPPGPPGHGGGQAGAGQVSFLQLEQAGFEALFEVGERGGGHESGIFTILARNATRIATQRKNMVRQIVLSI